MKLVYLSTWMFFCFVSGNALSQDAIKAKQNINGEKVEGYYVEIGFKSLGTEKFWNQSMKEISKPREKRDYYLLSDLKLGNLYYPELQAYSKYLVKDSVVGFWFGVSNLSEIDSTNNISTDLQNFVTSLPAKYFEFAMNQKIDEAERALLFTQKSINKLQANNKTLDGKLEYKRNELEKYQNLVESTELQVYSLEQQIKRNEEEILNKEIDLQKMEKLIAEYRSKVN